MSWMGARVLLLRYCCFWLLLCSCSGVLGRFFIMLLYEGVVGGCQGVVVIVVTSLFLVCSYVFAWVLWAVARALLFIVVTSCF